VGYFLVVSIGGVFLSVLIVLSVLDFLDIIIGYVRAAIRGFTSRD
jgi:hypothetical protein